MEPSTNYKVSYNPSLTPLTPHSTYDFVSELEEYTSTLYQDRVTKVADDTPLLSSVSTPYYENTQLDTITAYSIDARNINKWIAHFLFEEPLPNGTPRSINFDVPPKKYTQSGDALFIETAFGELSFEIDDTETFPVDVDDNEVTLTVGYNLESQEFELVFEESGSLEFPNSETENNQFDTTYDTYHSQLNGWTADQHQPFAIYSPAVEYDAVKERVEKQTDDAIVLITDDEWRVCVRSSDEDDYNLDVSLVELLDPVSDAVVQHYETFPYPQRYIHVPELQYLDSLDSMVTPAEAQKLRVLPYAVPFGEQDLLFDKLRHAEQFTREVETDSLRSELCYEQFFEQVTDPL